MEVIKLVEKYMRENDIEKIITKLYEEEEISNATFGHALSAYEFDVIDTQVKAMKKSLTLRQFIIEKLAEKNMSQQELAEKSLLSSSYISNILKGYSSSKYRLIRIALVLELDLKETKELLATDGKAFDYSIKDKVIISCINNRIYDFNKVEDALKTIAKEPLLD